MKSSGAADPPGGGGEVTRPRPEAPTVAWREAFDRFEHLASLENPAADAYLAAVAIERPDLHAPLATLLRAHRNVSGADFMAPMSPDGVAGPVYESLAEGMALGPYRLERRLGEGGMGEVWLARRSDGLFDSPVALKLLHAHLQSATLRERFLREGRILGQLSHPHIARLLDAGALPDRRLYLALEFVEGERIDHWCDSQRLTVERRVQVFLQVCEAVSHAHTRLAVHRDLKPSNILVTDDGDVKLLDFGIAKLIERETTASEATELTRVGGRALTPEYAAPEQILGAPITTATDVYALGVILYALLCGRRPYGTQGEGATEIERMAVEVEPQPPSRAERTAGPTDAGDVAGLRRSSSPQLRLSLRGDLDTIVLKALKKAPAERYPTVAALADDLHRYLEQRPVLARPDSLAYRTRKYLRRNRVGVLAAIAVAGALTAGVVGIVLQARETEREAVRARATRDFLVDIFEQNSLDHPEGPAARNATAEQLLATGARRIREQLRNEPELRADLLVMMADLYESLGIVDAEMELRRQHLATVSALLDEDHRDVALARSRLGIVLVDSTRYDEGVPLLESLVSRFEEEDLRTSVERAHLLNTLAHADYVLADVTSDRAIRHIETALDILSRHHPDDLLRVPMLTLRAMVASQRDDVPGTERWVREVIRLTEGRTEPQTRMARATAMSVLGLELAFWGRMGEAERLLRDSAVTFESVLGAGNPLAVGAKGELADALIVWGRSEEALAILDTVEPSSLVSDESYRLDELRLIRGKAYLQRGEVAKASTALEEVADFRRRMWPGMWNEAIAQSFLARAVALEGRWAFAEELQGKSEERVRLSSGENSVSHAIALVRRADMRRLMGRHDEAEPLYRHVLEQRREDITDWVSAYPQAEVGLAQLLVDTGRHAEGLALMEGWFARFAGVSEPAVHVTREASARAVAGQALLRAGRVDEAAVFLERAVELRSRTEAPISPLLALSRIWLAEIRLSQGRRADARELLASARKALESHPRLAEDFARRLREAQAKLRD